MSKPNSRGSKTILGGGGGTNALLALALPPPPRKINPEEGLVSTSPATVNLDSKAENSCTSKG